MKEPSIIEQKLRAAIEKMDNDITTGKVNKSEVDELAVWMQFLSAKLELERERNGKDVG
jgi:hypothetical protein